jgi:hypothetical protein
VDLYIRSPIRLHGVVLNSLSTGTTLTFLSLFLTRRRISGPSGHDVYDGFLDKKIQC